MWRLPLRPKVKKSQQRHQDWNPDREAKQVIERRVEELDPGVRLDHPPIDGVKNTTEEKETVAKERIGGHINALRVARQ